jgi:hypothetical protein
MTGPIQTVFGWDKDMARQAINNEPMGTIERNQRSRAGKLKRGEIRVDTWLSPEASQALRQLTGGLTEKGVVKSIIEEALKDYAEQAEAERAHARGKQ